MAVKHDIAQIQIIPVEDGYFIQMINADGSGQRNPRHVASSREELVLKLKKLVEDLFTKEPPPQPQHIGPPPSITRTPPPTNGTPEPQSPVGA